MMSHRLPPWNWLLLSLALLPACASYAPPAVLSGMSRDEVLARMGPPDKERRLDAGSRLEFPRGPLGKQTWFVYFDTAGRASRAEQVLTEQNFSRIDVGMAQDDVRQLLGRPGVVQALGRERGVVWCGATATTTISATGFRWSCRCNNRCARPASASRPSATGATCAAMAEAISK